MKTQNIKTLRTLSIAIVALTTGLLLFSVGVSGESGTGSNAQLIYQSQSVSPNIYSYPSNMPGEVSLKPELIYVSQANGPAIYSYPHSGTEKAVPWNVEYVDTAYGPDIYSYDRHQVDGKVSVLPIVSSWFKR